MSVKTYFSKEICRLCLYNEGVQSLFLVNALQNYRLTCADFIMKVSSVPVYEKDGLPQKICKQCFSKLRTALKFKVFCEESYVKLLTFIQTRPKTVSVPGNCQNKETVDLNNKIKIEDDTYLADNENDDSSKFDVIVRSPSKDNSKGCDETSSERSLIVDIPTKNDFTGIKIEEAGKVRNVLSSESSDSHRKASTSKWKMPFTPFNKKNDHSSGCSSNGSQPVSQSESRLLQAESVKKYQCELCPKIFLRSASLKLHLLKHNGELPFKCPHPGCAKAFPIKSRLVVHMKVHTNERPFICQYCSHAARDKQQLNVHIRYFHTKERNFTCKVCGKGFVSPQALYYHAKRHENVRNHHCTYCKKSFVFAFGLQEHLLTHTGEKRFACVLCGTKFSRKAHKLKHEASVHGLALSLVNRPPRSDDGAEKPTPENEQRE